MRVIRDGIQLCQDCMIMACNGDATGIDSDERLAEVIAGLERLGPNLVPSFDSETGEGYDEFSSSQCGCCESKLAGSRHDFAILG